ncbi:MAG: glycosyltransferase family 39 protein [Planctomycetes bacterium]|nr:glycosyltransferase family 39 protein [Planctomycetota bacterium]
MSGLARTSAPTPQGASQAVAGAEGGTSGGAPSAEADGPGLGAPRGEILDRAGPWLGGWAYVVPILLLAAVRGLWAPDEPRYAEVAREAWEGDLLVMHLNGEVYVSKPPLVYWLAGLFGKLGGWHEFALRIPSIVATVLLAWIAARLARRLWGELEARWTPLFVLGTAMVLEIGGRLQLDPVLACLCLAAIERATDDRGSRAERGRARLVAGLCAGLAALAKGPVAWLHVGVGVLALRIARDRDRDAEAPRGASWVLFAFLAVLPVLAWGAAASLVEHGRSGSWDLFRSLFFGQHFGRVIEGTEHRGPPWEHLVNFPLFFLPLTPFFVAGFARAWRAWRGHRRIDDRALVAVAVWFAVLFLVFSAMPPKRDLYLLPIYPAAALLAARAVAQALRGEAPLARAWGLVSGGLWALLGVAGLGAVLVLASRAPAGAPANDLDEAAAFVAAHALGLAAVFAALLVGGALATAAFLRGRLVRGLDSIALASTVALTLAALFVVPAVDPLKSARALAEELAARPEKPTEIPCIGVQPEGYRFYGGVPAVKLSAQPAASPAERALTVEEQLETVLAREGEQFLALVAEKNFATFPETLRARLRVLGSWSVGSRDILVLGAPERAGEAR